MRFITHSLLLNALGHSLINSLWQMGLLWLVYLALTRSHSRFTAAQKHLLALVSVCIGSLWFIASLVAGLTQPADSHFDLQLYILNTDHLLLKDLYSGKQLVQALVPYLSFMYLGGLIFFFIRYFRQYRYLRLIRGSGLEKIQPRLRLFASVASARMGIRKKVSVWLSSVVDSPVTIGFLKPMILIPIATINHLTTEQVEAILLHELSHIRRNDYLVNLLVTWIGIAFFYNPFARLLLQTIRKERENSCDDFVLQFQYNPHDYASALLSLEKSRFRPAALALPAIGRSQQLLLERVKRVTGHSQPGRRFHFPALFLFLLCLAIGSLMILQPRQPEANKTLGNPLTSRITESAGQIFISPALTIASAKRELPRRYPVSRSKATVIAHSSEKEEPGRLVEHWVNDPLAADEEITADPSIQAVLQDQPREYSIITLAPPPPPLQAEAIGESPLPYVPSSSFSFQLQEDSSKPGKYRIMDLEREETVQAKRQALQALDKMDWQKLAKEWSVNGRKPDMIKLKKELKKCLSELDWNKMETRPEAAWTEADQLRIRESLQLQMDHLEKLKLNEGQARSMTRAMREKQMRMQEDTLKKQMESVRKFQLKLKKRPTIVYI